MDLHASILCDAAGGQFENFFKGKRCLDLKDLKTEIPQWSQWMSRNWIRGTAGRDCKFHPNYFYSLNGDGELDYHFFQYQDLSVLSLGPTGKNFVYVTKDRPVQDFQSVLPNVTESDFEAEFDKVEAANAKKLWDTRIEELQSNNVIRRGKSQEIGEFLKRDSVFKEICGEVGVKNPDIRVMSLLYCGEVSYGKGLLYDEKEVLENFKILKKTDPYHLFQHERYGNKFFVKYQSLGFTLEIWEDKKTVKVYVHLP
eukprot:GHVP01014617.1.p1 GENE.GHVP01014617.1~~GHVP01014617.1.p1  ORF type:complete len:283 (-),score=67.17 GHVP01014617.1:41-805(-)